MIDGVGKSGRIDPSRLSTAGVAPTSRPDREANGARVGKPASPAAEMAAAGPPVDAGKVAAIRAAIAEGRYPVDPARIADRMLALDLPPRN